MTKIVLISSILLATALAAPSFAQANLVRNGDFEQGPATGAPEAWATAGDARVKQVLARDTGREGKGFAAKLTCTEFADGTPSSHAMICQVGAVGVKRGRWYRLSFWARGEGIRGAVDVGLSNTRTWESTGLSGTVSVLAPWKRYEVVFQASADVPAEVSRLQIWFRSVGTLWLDDVELAEANMSEQRHPQLQTAGRTNFIPNSSFECGAAGWGSYSPDLAAYWYGNFYQLLGELDATTAAHGGHSLRLSLNEQETPTYSWDYFDPVHHTPRCVIAAHQGWLPAQKGQSYTLSASLKADQPGRVGVLFVRPANGRPLRKEFPLTTAWQRYSFTFTPNQEFLWTGVGLDLDASKAQAGTVWIDAVQLEKGAEATAYHPCAPVEVMAAGDTPGNFAAAQGSRSALPLKLRAFNDSDALKTLPVSVAVTDFFDNTVLRRTFSLPVPARSSAVLPVTLPLDRQGFFRVQLSAAGAAPQLPLRYAAMPSYTAKDSRFGVNHAYPWDFMLPLAQQMGVTWWRDWSTQWRTVQPQPNAAFDFREPDIQIDRVLKQGGNSVCLLPYPSAIWSSAAEPAAVAKVEGYNRTMALISHKPKEDAGFGEYAGQCAAHYQGRLKVYQLLNESLYTHYALPAAAGHTLDDYLRLQRVAYEAIKVRQPDAKVLAGLGIWADSHWTKEFVEAGGLKYADMLDVHLYPAADPEHYAESLAALWKRMQERGEAKPIWLTELGCYADDDPAITPFAPYVGDAAMRRALHESEREASEWLVKFATLFFANGGEKIFLHAGTCGEINGTDAGGVFFEYGGAPRKMLAAVAVLSRLLPPEAKFVKQQPLGEKGTACWFDTPAGRVGVAWATDGGSHPLPSSGMQVLDLMGNPAKAAALDGTPVYLLAARGPR